MGKSGKKVKSDKINALRKQYDAFLEDDKKRRDRNEYILGRLEDMRSSTTLIRIRHKDNSHIAESYLPTRRIPSFDKYVGIDDSLRVVPAKTNDGVDVPKQFESSILREISKNYILIPKVKSSFLNGLPYSNPSIDDVDTDWKSKYNILNELKKNEKESISDEVNDVKFNEKCQPILPVSISLNKQDDKINDNKPSIDDSDDTFKSKNYKLEQNLNSITSNKTGDQYNTNENNKSIIKNEDSIKYNQQEAEIPNKCVSFSKGSVDQNIISDTIQNKTDYEDLHSGNKFEETSNVTQYTHNQTNDIHQNVDSIESKLPDEQPEEIIQVTDNIVNEKPIQQNTEDALNLEERNAVNFEKSDGLMLSNQDNIQISEGPQENIIGKEENEIENTDIQNYESHEGPMSQEKIANEEINDLEKEQNEMFYAEKSDENYDYEQDNINASEYAAENENYTNEQYPYYDESQQQQPYASEINEHEESTERYDPTYEQQYAGDYGNDVNQLQYENPQYEVENSFEIQDPSIVQNEIQPTNENLEQLKPTDVSYQNQQDPEGYNYETQAVTNENYDSQQYVANEQQEYTQPAISEQDQYVAEQENTQIHTDQENINDMERQLDTEDGYIVSENTSQDITQSNIANVEGEISPANAN